MGEEKKLYISKGWITGLFIYYFLVFVLGIILAIIAVMPSNFIGKTQPVMNLALFGSIGMALNGSSIYYIRKLYKLCFNQMIEDDDEDNTYIKRLGTIVYFIGRPLFGIGFSFLIVIGNRSGHMLTSSGQAELNAGFVYLNMFFSFFVGFLAGRFIKKLELIGDKVLEKVVQ